MRRASLAAAAVAASITLAPVAAWAAWTSAGSGSGTVAATTVNQATAPTAIRGASKVDLTWASVKLANDTAVAGYDVIRHVGSSTTTVCSYVTAATCTDTAPVAEKVSYGVIARIGANWQGAESPTTTFTYDNVAPTTSLTTAPAAPNPAGWFNQDVTVTLTASDPGSPAAGVREIDYTIDNGTPQVVPGNTATFTVSAEKASQISYGAVDKLGNTEASYTATINLDKTAPTSSISPSSGTTPISAMISANDGTGNGSGVASITYRIDAGTNTTVKAATATVSVPSGAHTVFWYSTDVAGNQSGQQSASYAAAQSGPVAPTNVTCTAGSAAANSITITWTGVSGATGYVVTRSPGGIDAVTGTSFTFTGSNNASGTASVQAQNAGGTSGQSTSINYTFGNGNNKAPVCN